MISAAKRQARRLPNLLDLRIVGWRRKLVYFVVSAIVILGVTRGGRALLGHADFFGPMFFVLILIATLYGARVFRTPTEGRLPARPLWQMTATSFLSRRMSLFFIFNSANLLTTMVAAAFGINYGNGGLPPSSFTDNLQLLVAGALLAVLYRYSGLRLRQRETPDTAS